jgi:Chaperone of endosialidase
MKRETQVKLSPKNKRSLFFLMVSFLICTFFSGAVFLFINTKIVKASINQKINYQGKLLNDEGFAVSNSDYNLRFRLCQSSDCSGGNDPLWTETHCYSPDSGATCNGTGTDQRVSVNGGIFNMLLGSVTSLASVDFDQSLYLEVQVGGSGTTPSWETLTPRKEVGSVPAAFNSDKLDGLDSAESGADAHIVKTDSSGDITTSADLNFGTDVSLRRGGADRLDLSSGDSLNLVSGSIQMAGTSIVTSSRVLQNITQATIDNIRLDGNTISATNDSGIYLYDNASNGIFIQDGGNVGIGTTTLATSKKLHVKGGGFRVEHASAGSYFDVVPDSTPGTFLDASHFFQFRVNGASSLVNAIRIKSDGNVGIGTTEPVAKLEVVGDINADTGNILIETSGYGFKHTVANAGMHGVSDYLRITNWDDSTKGISLQVSTGNIGIGTTAPNNKLDVYDDITTAGDQLIGRFQRQRVAGGGLKDGLWIYNDGVGVGGKTKIKSTGSSLQNMGLGATGEELNILTSGNIGIGTTAPGAKLDVVGGDGVVGMRLRGSEGKTSIDWLDGGANDPGYARWYNNNAIIAQVGLSGTYFNTGNIGIGTTAPSAKLNIIQSHTNVAFSLEEGTGYGYRFLTNSSGDLEWKRGYDGTNWSTFMTFDRSSGNVGIGTTDPVELLHINKADVASLKVEATASSKSARLLLSGKNAGGTVVDWRIVSENTENLAFYGGLTGSLDTRMVIQSDGNVGIGTTEPNTLLEISKLTPVFTLEDTKNGSWTADEVISSIDFRTLDTSGGGIGNIASIKAVAQDTTTTPNGALAFWTGATAGFAERVRIDNNGNVGIGTTGPSGILHAVGENIYFDALGGETRFVISPSNAGGDSRLRMYNNAEVNTIDLNSNGASYFNNGNVGIGTTGPTGLLTINSGANQLFEVYTDEVTVNEAGQDVDFRVESNVDANMIFAQGSNGFVGINDGSPESIFSIDSVAGADVFNVLENGNIGIGTTEPINKLHIDGGDVTISHSTANADVDRGLRLSENPTSSPSGFDVVYNGDSNLFKIMTIGGSERLVIHRDTGNIGIGTTSPEAKLNVIGSTRLEGTFGNVFTDGNEPYFFASTNSDSAEVKLISYNTVISADEEIGQLSFNITPDNSNVYPFSSIRSFVDGAVGGVTDLPSRLSFYTIPDGSDAQQERMTIKNDGNVGINDTTPTYKLDVNGTGRFTGALIASNLSGTNTGDQTITLTGDVTGSGAGSFSTTIAANAVALATDTTGNYVASITGGSGIASTGATSGENINHTLTLDLSELTTSTTNGDGDYFAVVDTSNNQKKLTKANIALSGFSNDAGWTNDQTATEILTAIKTVDGSGSGLDADLWDGNQFASYLNQAVLTTSDIRADNFLIDTSTVINDAALTLNDTNRYVWTVGSGWGQYWDTGNNSIDWYGGGVERGVFDLDDGSLQMDGNLSVGTTNTSARIDAHQASDTSVLRVIMDKNNGGSADVSLFYDSRGYNGTNTGTLLKATTYIGSSGNSAYTLKTTRSVYGTEQNTFTVRGDGYVSFWNPAGNGSVDMCYHTTVISGMKTLAACGSLGEYKEEIEDLELSLDVVKQLRPVSFVWKDGQGADLGFIAEEVEQADPLLASYLDGELNGVKYKQLTAVLVNAIQEMTDIIDLDSAPRDISSISINSQGNVGIGTTTPESALHVNGDVRISNGSFIDDGTTLNVPDYVFEQGYDLKTIEELENYINTYGHLPNVASREEIKREGMNYGNMIMSILEKTEENALYAIDNYKILKQVQDDNDLRFADLSTTLEMTELTTDQKITLLGTNQERLETQLSLMDSRLRGNDSRVLELEEGFMNHEERIMDNEGKIMNHESRIVGLGSAINQTALQTITSQIKIANLDKYSSYQRTEMQTIEFYDFSNSTNETSSTLNNFSQESDYYQGDYQPADYQEITVNLDNPLDISDYQTKSGFLNFEIYLEDADTIEDLKTELGNQRDANEIEWTKSDHPFLTDGWNKIRLPLNIGTKTGEIDPTDIKYFRTYFKFNSNNNIQIRNVELEMYEKSTIADLDLDNFNLNQDLDLTDDVDQGKAINIIARRLDDNKILLTSLSEREGQIDQQLNQLTITIDNLNSLAQTTTDLLTDHEMRIVALESNTGINPGINTGINLSEGLQVLDERLSVEDSGGEYLFAIDGSLKVDRVETAEVNTDIVIAGDYVVKEDAEGENENVGSVIIKTGEQEVFIANNKVKYDSKIIVTPVGSNPVNWIVSEKIDDEGFKIKLSDPAEFDIAFDYWVIRVN